MLPALTLTIQEQPKQDFPFCNALFVSEKDYATLTSGKLANLDKIGALSYCASNLVRNRSVSLVALNLPLPKAWLQKTT